MADVWQCLYSPTNDMGQLTSWLMSDSVCTHQLMTRDNWLHGWCLTVFVLTNQRHGTTDFMADVWQCLYSPTNDTGQLTSWLMSDSVCTHQLMTRDNWLHGWCLTVFVLTNQWHGTTDFMADVWQCLYSPTNDMGQLTSWLMSDSVCTHQLMTRDNWLHGWCLTVFVLTNQWHGTTDFMADVWQCLYSPTNDTGQLTSWLMSDSVCTHQPMTWDNWLHADVWQCLYSPTNDTGQLTSWLMSDSVCTHQPETRDNWLHGWCLTVFVLTN